jgi:hypothetical protein
MKRTRFLVRLDKGGQGAVKSYTEAILKLINAQKMRFSQLKSENGLVKIYTFHRSMITLLGYIGHSRQNAFYCFHPTPLTVNIEKFLYVTTD